SGPAVDDGAFDPHQSDVLAQARRRRRRSNLAARALPGPDADGGGGAAGKMPRQLFLTVDPVDSMLVDRDVVSCGRAVDQLCGGGPIEQPRLGDRGEELLVL